MEVLAQALRNKELIHGQNQVDPNITIRMLRAEQLPMIAAIFQKHQSLLFARVSTVDFHQLVDSDLEELRNHFEVGDQNGKAYCDQWRRRGYLIRRAADGKGETYELSHEAIAALDILRNLETPTSAVTASRIATIVEGLKRLVVESSTDASQKLAALQRERDRIEREIEMINSGDYHPISDEQALERINDLLSMVRSLPADFARVRHRFEQLNQTLRTSLLKDDNLAQETISGIFDNIDFISESEEGKTFNSFLDLIRDDTKYSELRESISQVSSSNFLRKYPDKRSELRAIVPRLKNGSSDIQNTLSKFATGLRRYVDSQDYRSDQALQRLITQALSLATQVATESDIKAQDKIDFALHRPKVEIVSISQIVPADPYDYDVQTEVEEAPEETVDYEEIRRIARLSEIDFDELRGNISNALALSKK